MTDESLNATAVPISHSIRMAEVLQKFEITIPETLVGELDTCRANYLSHNVIRAQEFETAQDRIINEVVEAYSISTKLLSLARHDGQTFNALLEIHQIKAFDDVSSLMFYRAAVRMSFGRFDPDKRVRSGVLTDVPLFRTVPSYEKYAAVLRHLTQKGVKVSIAANYIKTFHELEENKRYGKYLIAIINKSRADEKGSEPDKQVAIEAVRNGMSGAEVFTTDVKHIVDNTVRAGWLIVQDGKLVFYGLMTASASHKAAERECIRMGASLLDKRNRKAA